MARRYIYWYLKKNNNVLVYFFICKLWINYLVVGYGFDIVILFIDSIVWFSKVFGIFIFILVDVINVAIIIVIKMNKFLLRLYY